MELRELKASDMGAVCKIMSAIGVKEFKSCFENVDVKDQKNVEAIGVSIAFEIAGIIIEHIPQAQKDVDTFLASLTGQKVSDIQNLTLADYGELIIQVVTKEEFKDFFNRVMKLFNP